MFYSVKLAWQQPKPASDQMIRIAKNFLVYAESVTEAELRINEWTPANYQDAVVDEVKKTPIVELGIDGTSEDFWVLKMIVDDGSEKQKPFVVVLNGQDLEEIVKKVKVTYSDCDVLGVQKYTVIVDEDLISTETRKLVPIEGTIDDKE